MINLVHAEWVKVRTTTMVRYLTGAALLINALLIVGTFRDQGNTAPGLNSGGRLVSKGFDIPHTTQQLRNLLGTGFQGYIIAVLLGVLVITTEFRHKTITTTFLVTPSRRRAVTAKITIAALLGVALALLMIATSVIAGGIALNARGGSFATLVRQLPAVAPGMVVAFALSSVLGVGIGSVITNQIAAVVGTMVWFFLLDALIVNLAHGAARWAPTGAATATAQLTRGVGAEYGLLAWWAGALLLVAYGLAFAGLGSALLLRRDVA